MSRNPSQQECFDRMLREKDPRYGTTDAEVTMTREAYINLPNPRDLLPQLNTEDRMVFRPSHELTTTNRKQTQLS